MKLYNRCISLKVDLCKVKMISQLSKKYYEKGKENVVNNTLHSFNFIDHRFYEP